MLDPLFLQKRSECFVQDDNLEKVQEQNEVYLKVVETSG